MRAQLADVAVEYERCLADYLALGSEELLSEAARLGRLALSEKLGVLDMVMIHHGALAGRPEASKSLSSAALFLCEALSSFEMAHRGFQDTSEAIVRMAQFALVVCHELRTPLTSIVTSLGMLQEILGAAADSNEARLIDNAVRSAAILKSRTDDLQDLVSSRAGILSLKMRMVEIGPLLSSIAVRMEPVARRAGMDIRLDVADGLPKVRADPNRLDQIVTNLVSNALKYAAEGKRLDVRARARESTMLIDVQDYGPGIDWESRSRIFQFGAPKSQEPREVTGMGIGLALCRELTEQHGGTIDVVTAAGKGTLFTIQLPLPGKAPTKEVGS
ncbi:MAG TPA: ATP-binding protein [Spirochaetia bacterium]|nr:ATP-binding protein [Spirochaetia bacterium]